MIVQPSVQREALSRPQILVAFVGLLLAMLLGSLDQTIVSTALPTIAGDLGGLQQLSWIVTAYLLASTVSVPLWGRIGDLYGRQRVFQVAIVIFLAGSALCGLAQNLPQLIGLRAFQGLGGGGMMTLAMALVADLVSPRERGRYQGYIQSVFLLSSVAGPLLGGFFVDQATWRLIFYVNLPIGLVALTVISAAVRLPAERREARIDFLGAAFLVAALTPILLVLSSARSGLDFSDPAVSVPLGIGLALLGAFVWQERRSPEPIVPFGLFRDRVVLVVSAALFLTATALFAVIVFIPTFLQVVTGVNATTSGLLILPLMMAMFVSTVITGLLMTATGRYKIFPILGLALVTVGLILLAGIGPTTSDATVSGLLVIFGVGFGMVTQILIVALQNAVDRRLLGTATAVANFFRALGGTLGVALYGAVFSSQLARWIPELVPGGTGRKFDPSVLEMSPAAIRSLPPAIRDGLVSAVARSADTVFLVAAPIAALALVTVLFLREQPLRGPVGSEAPAQRRPEVVASASRARASAGPERAGVRSDPR